MDVDPHSHLIDTQPPDQRTCAVLMCTCNALPHPLHNMESERVNINLMRGYDTLVKLLVPRQSSVSSLMAVQNYS